MLYASIINGEINLTEDKKDECRLATYDELIEELCLGNMEIDEFTIVKEGIVTWDKEECELNFVVLRN